MTKVEFVVSQVQLSDIQQWSYYCADGQLYYKGQPAMTILESLEKELSTIVENGFYSINFDEDNKTITYIYLDGKFSGTELCLIGEVFSKYKGKDAHEVAL